MLGTRTFNEEIAAKLLEIIDVLPWRVKWLGRIEPGMPFGVSKIKDILNDATLSIAAKKTQICELIRADSNGSLGRLRETQVFYDALQYFLRMGFPELSVEQWKAAFEAVQKQTEEGKLLFEITYKLWQDDCRPYWLYSLKQFERELEKALRLYDTGNVFAVHLLAVKRHICQAVSDRLSIYDSKQMKHYNQIVASLDAKLPSGLLPSMPDTKEPEPRKFASILDIIEALPWRVRSLGGGTVPEKPDKICRIQGLFKKIDISTQKRKDELAQHIINIFEESDGIFDSRLPETKFIYDAVLCCLVMDPVKPCGFTLEQWKAAFKEVKNQTEEGKLLAEIADCMRLEFRRDCPVSYRLEVLEQHAKKALDLYQTTASIFAYKMLDTYYFYKQRCNHDAKHAAKALAILEEKLPASTALVLMPASQDSQPKQQPEANTTDLSW